MSMYTNISCAKICGKPQPQKATNGSVYYKFRFEDEDMKHDAQIFEDSPAYEKFEKMHLALGDYVNILSRSRTKGRIVKKEVVVNGEKITIEVPVKVTYYTILDIDFSIPKEIAVKYKEEPAAKITDVPPITGLGGFFETC